MSNLTPKRIVTKNGIATTVHVRVDEAGAARRGTLPAPSLDKNGAKITAADQTTPERVNLLARMMKPFTGRKAAKEAAVLRARQEDALSALIRSRLPAGMQPAPEVLGRLSWGIAKLDNHMLSSVHKFMQKRDGTALPVMGILQYSLDPSRDLAKTIGNFYYARDKLGWAYAPAAFDFMMDGLPDEKLSTEQARAVLKLENTLYTKDLTPKGGNIATTKREKYPECFAQTAIERPQDIDRIIEIAETRTVHHAAHLDALLDDNVMPVLAEGAL
jgi:hypothetical protein